MNANKNEFAVIGWGSLIWNPNNLRIKSTNWFNDGPRLPIEFARKSDDGRITLVIFDKYINDADKWVTTYWNNLYVASLYEAIQNLKNRECTTEGNVGYVCKDSSKGRIKKIVDHIKEWCIVKNVLGVVWTDLSPNIEISEAITYLKDLQGDCLRKSMEYIGKTPPQIRTPLRKIIEEELSCF